MNTLILEGLTELRAEDDCGAVVYLTLEHHMGGRERMWLSPSEVKQLAEWLTEWMKENGTQHDAQ